jgi:valyl-tRNA synthetase
MQSLLSQYKACDHEDEIYKKWEESGAFSPSSTSYKLQATSSSFSLVMPPPNATGTLHIGHAVMLAIEDIMVRYHRMKGEATVWIPGTDHAAIATQTTVEKKLLKESGKRRSDLGRENFLQEVEKFVAASQERIKLQIRKMGASCDWSREAYTLDEQRSLAVRTAFKMLYDKGLIYRGERVVNWCPRCQSTLADDEVEYKEEKTPFYYFKYGPVIIGTARPETKFQDKTIVVNPEDARYKHLIGTKFEVEWIEGKVMANVIADPAVDLSFGTGAMTITPAHSFEDFELARKHALPVTLIIDEFGKLTPAAGSFAGQKARAAREEIVAKLRAKGLVEKIDENYIHNLSVCYRCGSPIEPLPKLQWFIDVNKEFKFENSLTGSDPLKGRTLREGITGLKTGEKVTLKKLMSQVVETGQIKIIPDYHLKIYFEWIKNLRDWCISRQIWFGHRVPVWYRTNRSNTTYVGVEPPEGEGWEQDPDTLDTWFSSGLWTFSTLGWPAAVAEVKSQISNLKNIRKPTSDLSMFHPTSVLETGYDILFFWIARMILMSTALLGEIPFRTVYLHGLVRDMQGRKMSKSLGNGIDPLDMVAKYGADAVRLSLFVGTAAGTDVKLNEQKIAGYRNFANKIWNASRFVLMNLDRVRPSEGRTLKESDQKILTELQEVVRDVTASLEKFDFNHAADRAYHYFWHTFCDKIIEEMKPRIGKEPGTARYKTWHDSKTSPQGGGMPGFIPDSADRQAAQYILYTVLITCLKLLHPFMPFVTEAVWGEVPKPAPGLLISEKWPDISLKS